MFSKWNMVWKSVIVTLVLVMSGSFAASAVDPADYGVVVETSPHPAIHGPRVVGTTPGRPFIFLIPATGDGPLSFAAEGLPPGLALDPATGIISGSAEREGIYPVLITVTGPAKQTAARTLNIVAGQDKLALTPSLGWNSWNVWGLAVDDQKVRAAADAMISSGLAAHGFSYVNIDDGWEAGRAADGTIMPNTKFPDMKALGDYIHGRGLKMGIYSSPGPYTCGRYEGSLGHEAQDAASYASWGVDYLKYDWCSYKVDVSGAGGQVFKDPLVWFKTPYAKMGELLDGLDRDIVYCICFYGLWKVEEWGAAVGGHQWRTTGDIRDTWNSMATIGFGQDGYDQFAGPGHWNDPDMLVVGRVGWGPNLHDSRLTPDEQITHITLWSLLASPLLIGCDMAAMDEFTLALLQNDEALEVNQDPLGIQASRKSKTGGVEIWARPLWDGTVAVGLFNRGKETKTVTASFSDLGLSGSHPVRDLWRHQDLGTQDGAVSASVPSHGAVFLKVGTPNADDYRME